MGNLTPALAGGSPLTAALPAPSPRTPRYNDKQQVAVERHYVRNTPLAQIARDVALSMDETRRRLEQCQADYQIALALLKAQDRLAIEMLKELEGSNRRSALIESTVRKKKRVARMLEAEGGVPVITKGGFVEEVSQMREEAKFRVELMAKMLGKDGKHGTTPATPGSGQAGAIDWSAVMGAMGDGDEVSLTARRGGATGPARMSQYVAAAGENEDPGFDPEMEIPAEWRT